MIRHTHALNPAAIGGIQLWLDFSDATTLFDATTGGSTPANGGGIARIEDKSGNGRNFTQTTAGNRPTYQTGVQNGRSIGRFNGSTQNLISVSAASTWTFLHNGTDYIIALVTKPGTSSDPNAGYAILATNAAASASHGMFIFYDDRSSQPRNNTIIHECDRNVSSTPSVRNISADGAWTPNVFSAVTILADPNNGTAANRSSIRINSGTAIANNTFTQAPTTTAPLGTLHIGSTTGSTFYLLGDIGEIIIVSGANATAQMASRIFQHLNAKWRI